MKKQAGFTLIELIMVLVILGILAAIAVPKYIDLTTKADQAAVKATAGALASASAMNYAAKVAGGTSTTNTNCNTTGALLVGGAVPTGYSIANLSLGAALGDTATCTLTSPNANTTSFEAIYTP